MKCFVTINGSEGRIWRGVGNDGNSRGTALTGVRFEPGEAGKSWAVAMNGFALCVTEYETAGDRFDFIVPADALIDATDRVLARPHTAVATLCVDSDARTVTYIGRLGYQVTAPLIEGTFPDWRKILSNFKPGVLEGVMVDPKLLATCIEACGFGLAKLTFGISEHAACLLHEGDNFARCALVMPMFGVLNGAEMHRKLTQSLTEAGAVR